MSDGLVIWLYGEEVARIERTRNRRLRLTYSASALRTYELGTPVLSLSLPVSPRPFPNEVTTSFLDGLLPEGDALRAIAEDLDLRATDTYSLISALGRDCAGALVIQPESDPAPKTPVVRTAEPLTDSDIAELIDNLRSAPLGISQRVRISLGGVQEKLLLTHVSSGTWGRPVDGTPSTHILKPQIRGFSQTVENEAFCMRVAGYAGLRVASVQTMQVEGRPLLVAQRYDRAVRDDGTIDRIHQEDFCQAFSISPRRKYEEDGDHQCAGLPAYCRQ